MKFTKMVSMITLGAFLAMAPMAFACEGEACKASGNFDIDVVALGGGLSGDLKVIPYGAAGGFGIAGGAAAGQASGEVTSFKIGKRTFNLGSTEANIGVTAGGLSVTEGYRWFYPGEVGVGSFTQNVAEVGGHVDGKVIGLGYSAGMIGGAGGQASLNASGLTTNPWLMDSKGVTGGIAGQGSAGWFIGGGISALAGSYEVGTDIYMNGFSRSESYRGINSTCDGWNYEYMGTEVSAMTSVNSYGYANDCGLGCAYLEGGYVAAGAVKTTTMQKTDSGFAAANASGSYTGNGDLGCDFYGAAKGYTATSVQTRDGFSGSIMSSSAGMKVTAQQNPPQQNPPSDPR